MIYIYVSYCYEKFELSDNKDNCHFDRVKDNEKDYELCIKNLV